MYKRYIFDESIDPIDRKNRLMELAGLEPVDEFEEILNEITQEFGCENNKKKQML